MYRHSSVTPSSETAEMAGSAYPGAFSQQHQLPVAFMPANLGLGNGPIHGQQQHADHAPGSIPMPQPMPMPMPIGALGIGGLVQPVLADVYPPPSPTSSTTSSQYPLQKPSALAHQRQHQFAQQKQPNPAPPMAAKGNYSGRNSTFFHDPTVPIPAILDTLKRQHPVTSSSSSIHSVVSSSHTLGTDPSNLPRQILDIERRVMLFVSASGTNPMSLGAFPHDIEDVMFASSSTPYDMEILPEYDTTSLDAAAKRLLLYIKLMSFDTKRAMHVMLVGVDVGGIVALEAVRMFLGAVNAQAPQFGARGPFDPRDREANWLLRVRFDGVLCINAPVFLLHPQVFGNVDRSAFGQYAGLFAFPPEAVQAHATGGSHIDAGSGGRKKDRGGVFGFGKLVKVVGGMAGSSSSPPPAGTLPGAPKLIPFDASWAARFELMSPLLRSHDDRVNRIRQLLHAKVPLAFLVTQTSNPQAVTSPTFVHIPDNLPESVSRLVIRFTAPPTAPASSYQLTAEALDKGRQPAMYAQMIQYITRVAGHWASVARENGV